MIKASRTLSEVSRNVGLVLAPALEEKLLEHIKFVNLPDRRVLVVIVSKPDLVENRVVRLQDEFTQEELDQWRRGTRLDRDQVYWSRTWQYIPEHPGEVLGRLPEKLGQADPKHL